MSVTAPLIVSSVQPASQSASSQTELRVLQVFDSLAMGGAETWLMALLRYLKHNDDTLPYQVQTDILLTGGAVAAFDEEAKQLGCQLFHRRFSRRNSVEFARWFRQLLRRGQYNAIHDHQDYSAGLRFMMGFGTLPPVRVAHVHNTSFSIANYNSSFGRRATFALARKALARTATHITSTSQAMLEDFGIETSLFAKVNRRVVHCGFDTESFSGDNAALHRQIADEFGWPQDSRIILFVGRLDEPVGNGLHRKNPAFALEVARSCIEKDPSVRMVMAGSGEKMRSELEAKVSTWGLSNQIRLTGIYPDVTRLMLGANLFLFPSLAEGLGMVVVEAQAAGLRVLTSTGVPVESCVLPQLVKFHPLDKGVSFWAEEALRMLSLPKPDAAECNGAVRRSPFSIENSAAALLEIYSGADRHGVRP